MKTPKDMLRTFAKAIREGDAGTVLYYGRVEDEWKDAIAQEVMGLHDSWRLKQTLLKTHGPGAWKSLLKSCKDVGLMVVPEEECWGQEMEIVNRPVELQDQAEFRIPESRGRVSMVKVNGAWYWDSRQGRGAFGPREFAEVNATIQKAVNRACEMAQRPESKIEDISRVIDDMLK